MLHPPKLLIHHNYKGILYYKNFPITIGNLIPLHLIQHIISLLLFFVSWPKSPFQEENKFLSILNFNLSSKFIHPFKT